MRPEEVPLALERAERVVAEGRGLDGTGFWPAVAEVRRNRALAVRYADRIGAIDQRAFERGVRIRVRTTFGIALLALGGIVGDGLITWAVFAGVGDNGDRIGRLARFVISVGTASPLIPAFFLVGTLLVVVSTHSLVHWMVGRLLGIRFTYVFLGGPPPPRPGVKTDYASYLRVAPQSRALMHASGAVVTKLVPFALLGNARALYDDWPWLTWVLIAFGIVQILTDVFLSTKSSDWKKVRRELRAARAMREP